MSRNCTYAYIEVIEHEMPRHVIESLAGGITFVPHDGAWPKISDRSSGAQPPSVSEDQRECHFAARPTGSHVSPSAVVPSTAPYDPSRECIYLTRNEAGSHKVLDGRPGPMMMVSEDFGPLLAL